MSIFQTLFRTPRTMIGDCLSPDRRSQLFPDVVRKSKRLHLWNGGDPVRQDGHRLLIGVATWSERDMLLLDLIDEANDCDMVAPIGVDVFDLEQCKNFDDIGRFIPGMGQPNHSPVAGLWKDGEITKRASGFEAQQMIRLWFGLDAAQRPERTTGYSKAS